MNTKSGRKAKPAKKTTAKPQSLPVVKFKPDTLARMGFLCATHGETLCNCAVKELNRIGKMLHKRGLTDEPEDWYVLTPKIRFACNGRTHEIDVEAYCPSERVYKVRFTQYPTEAEVRSKPVPVMMPAWIAKRLEQIAEIVGNEGGVPEMLDSELGCQLLGRNPSFVDLILDTGMGSWEWEPGEYDAAKAKFKALGIEWEREDAKHLG